LDLAVRESLARVRDIRFRQDVRDRNNFAAAIAIGGLLLGSAIAYAGGNIGDGPGFHVVVFSALLSTATVYSSVWVLALVSDAEERVSVDHDVGAPCASPRSRLPPGSCRAARRPATGSIPPRRSSTSRKSRGPSRSRRDERRHGAALAARLRGRQHGRQRAVRRRVDRRRGRLRVLARRMVAVPLQCEVSARLPRRAYKAYRLDAIFVGNKWDPQLHDHSTVADRAIVIGAADWAELTARRKRCFAKRSRSSASCIEPP
jgi:hypothetical protein